MIISIPNFSRFLENATYYESEVRYPTDQKLLWESVEWRYKQLTKTYKDLGIKVPRTKHLKWKKRNLGYSKVRRKTKIKENP